MRKEFLEGLPSDKSLMDELSLISAGTPVTSATGTGITTAKPTGGEPAPLTREYSVIQQTK